MENAMILSSSRRVACTLAATSVVALSASLAAIPEVAFGQAFQGGGTVSSGTASILTGAGTTTITVASPEVVIDWQAIAPTTGNVNFLPTGSVATFQDAAAGVPLTDYTVLNRIQPGNFDVTGLFVPTARAIEFNGTVQSVLGSSTGGNIWFYSPTGIIAGNGAAFNTGSLVLTTNAIDTTGGLYGAGNTVRFRGTDASQGFVRIDAGARIGNGGKSAQYVAVVAPRVVQAGAIDVKGSIALVAAEQADIKINAGLFDIEILAGSNDISGGPPFGSGIVHSGTTGGPASTGTADVQQIQFVSLAKNTSLTMLLSGSIGYAPAAVATNDGSSILLSAGPVSASQFNLGPGNNRILINPTVFSNFVTGYAYGFIDTNTLGGLIDFQRGADLFGSGGVFLTADVGRIHATNLTLTGRQQFYPTTSGFNGVDVDLIARQGGSIEIDNALVIDVRGIDLNGTVVANGQGANGGDAGIVALTGGLISAGSIFADASGFGNGGTATSGFGLGGSVFLDVQSGGSITAPIVDLTANGIGGTYFLPTGALGPAGGYGRGGSVSITNRGGSFDINEYTATASAQSGLGAVSQGATDTTGGGVYAYFDAGVQTFANMTLIANAATPNQANGSQAEVAIGGIAELRVAGVDTALTVNGNLNLQANATTSVNGVIVPGDGAGFGEARILVRDSGSLTVRGDTQLEANAGFDTESLLDIPVTTANLFGGDVSVLAESGGTIAVANLTAVATAFGMAASGQASTATGGTTTVGAQTGGSFGASVVEGTATVILGSLGLGASGAAPAHAVGGTATLFAQDGTIIIAGVAGLVASGLAESFTDIGANATGGTASVELRAGATGSIQADSLVVDASGYARDPGGNSQPSAGNGGIGTGGTATVSVVAGNLTSGPVVVRANGLGGDAIAPASGGSGVGGSANMNLADGQVSLGATRIEANGQGGTGDGGGNATGGVAAFRLVDTGAGPGALRTLASLALSGNAEPGGAGSRSGGATVLTVQPGAAASALSITGNLSASASGLAGAASIGFNGSLTGAPLVVGGNATISAFRSMNLTVGAGSLLDVTGTLTVDGDRTFTSTGLVRSGAAALISSDLGINMSNLQSGGTTGLQAITGPVALSNLQSVGVVTAAGQSVALTSPGALTFGTVSATAGDLDVSTVGAVTFNQGYTATGAVTVRSGGAYAQAALGVGNIISIFSTDFVLNTNPIGPASLGARGTTQAITLTNTNPGRPTFIGGVGNQNGYSLSATEASRIFANQRIAIIGNTAPPVPLPADFIVGDLSLTYGAAGNLGNGGEFKIDTNGRVIVNGAVRLTTSNANDAFSIDPTFIDIITDGGSIFMLNDAGSPLGTMNLTGGTITVADSSAFSALASASGMQAINTILDQPAAAASNTGFLQAGQINFDVTGGLFIQNTGTGTAYGDRRGFTAGGISITTSNAETQISINGQILNNAGVAITGLDTANFLMINGVTGNFRGLFDTFSTSNGCFIGVNCNFSEGSESINLSEPGINKPLAPEGTDSNSLELPIVDVVENDTEGSPPLVDEPVTGVGNDDLWQKDCAEGEKCEA